MSRKYTIIHAGFQPNSSDLKGLVIEQITDGFHLAGPNGVLATASLVNIPDQPLLKFHLNRFRRWDWTLFVDRFSVEEMHGTWVNNNKQLPEEGDSWTASGTGAGESGDDEARAASAK